MTVNAKTVWVRVIRWGMTAWFNSPVAFLVSTDTNVHFSFLKFWKSMPTKAINLMAIHNAH